MKIFFPLASYLTASKKEADLKNELRRRKVTIPHSISVSYVHPHSTFFFFFFFKLNWKLHFLCICRHNILIH